LFGQLAFHKAEAEPRADRARGASRMAKCHAVVSRGRFFAWFARRPHLWLGKNKVKTPINDEL